MQRHNFGGSYSFQLIIAVVQQKSTMTKFNNMSIDVNTATLNNLFLGQVSCSITDAINVSIIFRSTVKMYQQHHMNV